MNHTLTAIFSAIPKGSGMTNDFRRELAAVAQLLVDAETEVRDRLRELARRLTPSPLVALMEYERIPWDAATYVRDFLLEVATAQGFLEIQNPAVCLRELAEMTDEALFQRFVGSDSVSAAGAPVEEGGEAT
jgi:hypothetical protein